MDRSTVETGHRELQDLFCSALETFHGTATFRCDLWERPGGGGGETRVLAGSGRIEKAALDPDQPTELTAHGDGRGDFDAEPTPRVTLHSPSRHWHHAKVRAERHGSERIDR